MATAIRQSRQLLYLRISRDIEKQIDRRVLRVGEQLPSIRMICGQYGVSMTTALQAYHELERKALIESRPQSGYYVSWAPDKFPSIPATSQPATAGKDDQTEEIVQKVYNSIANKNLTMLSLGVPAPELLPIAKLNKALLQAVRELPDSGTGYENTQGNSRLRRLIAKSSYIWKGNLTEDDLVTTSGCMNSIAYCLMTLTQRGDTVAVESPLFFGILQLAKSLGLQVLELPTNAQTGIEPDALKKALQTKKIKACLLVSNFNNPLGSCMPDEHKKEVVALLEQYNVPLIEDDLYGDVYFGDSRPKPCKAFDESGIVLWCGSVSKTLAPGYRVGWVAPGRFTQSLLRLKMYHSLSSPNLLQETIANFLEKDRYAHYLVNVRRTLHANSIQFIRAISEYFPEGTRVTRPQGGFMLWVELNKKIDTMELYEAAMKQKISIAPGRMFTLHKQFDHCMRLSYGSEWSERLDGSLKILGRLAKNML